MRALSPFALATLLSLASTAALAQEPQNANDLNYDQLMRYDILVRKDLFSKSNAASKARLTREQLERGLATYRPQLTAQQTGLLEYMVARTVAEVYEDSAAATSHREALRPLMEEAERAFDKTQFVMLFTLNGSAFPNKEPAK